MARMKTSKIWITPKEILQQLIDESNSLKEVLEKLGFEGYIGRHRDLNVRIKEESLDISSLIKRRKDIHTEHLKNISTPVPIEELLIENSLNNTSLRRRIIREQLLEYVCCLCGVSEWRGESLSLHLDHKNGIKKDNRIENLRFLCPNCHQQTDTWGAKKQERFKT